VRSPSFTARFFAEGRVGNCALHEHADHAMVIEGWPT
jgi:hypothetical protein